MGFVQESERETEVPPAYTSGGLVFCLFGCFFVWGSSDCWFFGVLFFLNISLELKTFLPDEGKGFVSPSSF